MADPIGFVLLTSQPNGSWKDDWDGEVHTDRATFAGVLVEAGMTLGVENVQGAVLYPVVFEMATDAGADQPRR